MAEIKLLSIKRNEEASYFYENNIENVSRTLDSNRNEVNEVQDIEKASEISKKTRKEEERKSKKEQNQKKNESKKREKEIKKSLKKSRKEIVGSVDAGTQRSRAEIKTNDNEMSSHLINTGFHAGVEVEKVAKNDESVIEHEESKKENEESEGEHSVTKHEYEEASSQHERISKEHEEASNGHELSMKTHGLSAYENVEFSGHATTTDEHENSCERHATAGEGHASPDNRAQMTTAVEETITIECVQHTEEAPPEMLPQPKVIPGVPEFAGGQHVEIEISDVTDLEADASSSDAVVNVGHGPQIFTSQNGAATEGQITAATVQQVEKGVDLDGFFAEFDESGVDMDKEEKRKSVRFQEETEEIESGEVGTEDHECASVNLGGDFAGTVDKNDVESRKTLEPAVEIVSKEQRGKVESCAVDLDEVFASPERVPNDEERPKETEHDRVEIEEVKVNGRAIVSDKTRVENGRTTKTTNFVEISLNDQNEHEDTAPKKKQKRKRSGLMRCCFP